MNINSAELKRVLQISGMLSHENVERLQRELFLILETEREKSPPMILVNNVTAGNISLALSFYDVSALMATHATTVASGDLDLTGLIVFLSGTCRIITPNASITFGEMSRVVTGTILFTLTDMEREAAEMRSIAERYADIINNETGGKLPTEVFWKMLRGNSKINAIQARELGLATE